MLQPAKYSGVPRSWGTGTAKTGTPYVYIEFNVTHIYGETDWIEMPHEIRTIQWYLSEGAFDRTMQNLDNIGFNGDFGPGMDFEDKFKNDGSILICKHETYQGKQKERWDLESAGGGGFEHESPNPEAIAKINAMYAKRKQETPF